MGVLYVRICNKLFCFSPVDKPKWWDDKKLPVNKSELEVSKCVFVFIGMIYHFK